jgi:predicted nucleic acid-binding protein
LIVVDASVVVAALVATGPHADGAERLLEEHGVVGPHLLPAEVASSLRRMERQRVISWDVASIGVAKVGRLKMQLFPFGPCSERVWELRRTVTPYDSWYVTLAESLDVPLATLDRRLAQASGPRCAFELPPEQG